MTVIVENPDLRIVTDGLRFPEGPVAMPDGSVALVEIEARRITRVAANGTKSTIATVGGAPNGLALGPVGMLYVCNNGGFSWHDEPGMLRPTASRPTIPAGGSSGSTPRPAPSRRSIAPWTAARCAARTT